MRGIVHFRCNITGYESWRDELQQHYIRHYHIPPALCELFCTLFFILFIYFEYLFNLFHIYDLHQLPNAPN